jgi:hypothetical protein
LIEGNDALKEKDTTKKKGSQWLAQGKTLLRLATGSMEPPDSDESKSLPLLFHAMALVAFW